VTYSEFQVELRRARLNNRAFAGLVGMHYNSVSNYSGGDVPQHLAVIAVLLAELAASGVDYQAALGRVGIVPKKARGGSKPGRFGGDPQAGLEFGS
jgi:hypothetical protein